MKKLILTICISCVLIVGANAQFTFGVKGGANISNLNGDIETSGSRTSFTLGGMAEVEITEKFSYQMELLYSSQGANVDNSLLGISLNDDNIFQEIFIDEYVKVDYLLIPMLAKYYFTERFSVELGPQIGILLSAKTAENGSSKNMKDATESLELAANFGLGYKLDNGLNFGVRYNLGLTNITKDVFTLISENELKGVDYKNNVFQFTVGYFFN